jgi:hypothetical protein
MGGLSVIVPQRLRAPREDGAVLAEPSLDEAGALLADNRRRIARIAAPPPGPSWEDLRRQSRVAAVEAARAYFRRRGEPLPLYHADSLLLAGHQPELFHPGVWVKNFALNKLARLHNATPINLVVDNDTVKKTLLHVPTRERQPPGLFRLASVPLDRWEGEAPYEERSVHDEVLFASLPQRVAPLVENWPFRPLLPRFWTEVIRSADHTRLLGERLAAGRRAWERRWGCHNLELPISLLCQTEPFAWFACHLLADLARFHAIYNDAVHQYRRKYGVRSANHPVPDLATEGDWLEVPLWAWRPGDTRRGRLFARVTGNQIDLRASNQAWPSLPFTPHPSPLTMPSVAAWQTLEQRGFKIRSRALTNTLYARVFLGDLFIHGIGGGKYDEVADEIIRRFYCFEPPRFLVLSATLLLPLPRFPTRADAGQHLAHERRDLHWNPQRHLEDHDARAKSLAAQKQAWIAHQPHSRPERHERFRTLRELTGQLHPYVAAREETLAEELVRCREQLAANEVLARRDYAFCLYPEAELRAFCTRFL